MSGIVGIHYLDGRPVEDENLSKMVDILAHRGPDGANIWVDGCVGLGHRMLWTTPESLIEKLPLVDQRGDLVITADARIDNREELIAALQINNRPADKVVDSELILAAYEKWGEDCPKHLLGDFAFAIWDKRKQILFCARDHFGVKPFYYYFKSNQSLIFASEIKAIFCVPGVSRHLNEQKLADYLAIIMEDQVMTTYQDVLRLPPAHCMVISQSGIETWLYWSLNPNKEIKLDSNQAYAEEFRRIFTEAVRCRLRSYSPVISHLSGGLDSSSITCVAREILKESGKQLNTISCIFDTITQCDERFFINSVLEQDGFIPHYVIGDEIGPLSNLDDILKYEDEAFIGPSHFYTWLMNRKIKDLKIRVCLDGFDGDTVVSHGMMRLIELARAGEWETLIKEIKIVAQNFENFQTTPYSMFRSYALPYLPEILKKWRLIEFLQTVQLIYQHFKVSRKRLIVNYGIKPVIKELKQLWQGKRKHFKNQFLTPTVTEIPIIKSSFAERINLANHLKNWQVKPPLSLKEQHWQQLTGGVITYILEQLDQYNSMFSLETRHPFMDKRLVEFCLALPSEQKLCDGWGRIVMRRALEGILPEQIQWRGGKANLTENFDDGLLRRNYPILDDTMSNKIQYLENYIDLDFIQAAYQRIISGKEPVKNSDSTAVWQAVTLALWMEYKGMTP